jgi:hypothetical protein
VNTPTRIQNTLSLKSRQEREAAIFMLVSSKSASSHVIGCLLSFMQTLCRRLRTSDMQSCRPRIQRSPPNRTALRHSSDRCFGSLHSHPCNFFHTHVPEEHSFCDIKAIRHWCGHFYCICSRETTPPLPSSYKLTRSSFSPTQALCSPTNV